MYTVVAGKFVEIDGEVTRDYKYISPEYATREEAEADLATCKSYAFAEIEAP